MTSLHDEFHTFEYITGQMRDSHVALLGGFEKRSADATSKLPHAFDLCYGPHPRQVVDVYFAEHAVGTVLYLHPGYWQSRDKATFRFLAEPFVLRGYNVALANYPLCPDVSLDELTESVSEVVPFLKSYLQERHPAGRGIIVGGHSAGGHLAVELALRSWDPSDDGRVKIEGVIAISGIYDLTPLVHTPLNVKLRLTISDAQRRSPIHRVKPVGIPALFIVGGSETSEFHRQSEEMAKAWAADENKSWFLMLPDADHFSVLEGIYAFEHPEMNQMLSNT